MTSITCPALLLLLLPFIALGERPQLVNADVWASDSRIMSTDFQTISGNLEFDQPLFLAESVLCPRAEEVGNKKQLRQPTTNYQQTIISKQQ